MDWGAFLIQQINILPIHSKPILRPFMKPYPRHCAINYTKVGESGGEWTLSTPTERLRPLHPHPLSIPSSSPWLSFMFSLTYFITALDGHLASRCFTSDLVSIADSMCPVFINITYTVFPVYNDCNSSEMPKNQVASGQPSTLTWKRLSSVRYGYIL